MNETMDEGRRALVVDDDDGIRWVLGKALAKLGVAVESVASAGDARAAFSARAFPLVFVDVRLPDGDGLSLLRALREDAPATRVVVITAQDAMSTALEAMKLGAYDFLAKPFDVAQVAALAEAALSRPQRMAEAEDEAPSAPSAAAGLVGQSRRLLDVVKAIGRAAPTDATVLLTGESGTGKELVARALHAHSARHRGPFVTVNTAAIPRELLESELYGHERGAFTGATERRLGKFELASGGTLFLDEIGDMPLDQQVKLLRVLQERRLERVGGSTPVPVDVRVVAASNVDIARAVEQRLFREDLYYRLNVVPLSLPALRERPEDIPLLVEHFLDRHRQETQGPRLTFTEGALRLLAAYPWPGNIRELENAVRRCVVMSRHHELDEAELLELVPVLRHGPARSAVPLEAVLREAIAQWLHAAPEGTALHEALLRLVEPPLLELVMEKTRNNQLRAAELLGLNRNTLRKMLLAYGLKE